MMEVMMTVRAKPLKPPPTGVARSVVVRELAFESTVHCHHENESGQWLRGESV